MKTPLTQKSNTVTPNVVYIVISVFVRIDINLRDRSREASRIFVPIYCGLLMMNAYAYICDVGAGNALVVRKIIYGFAAIYDVRVNDVYIWMSLGVLRGAGQTLIANIRKTIYSIIPESNINPKKNIIQTQTDK